MKKSIIIVGVCLILLNFIGMGYMYYNINSMQKLQKDEYETFFENTLDELESTLEKVEDNEKLLIEIGQIVNEVNEKEYPVQGKEASIVKVANNDEGSFPKVEIWLDQDNIVHRSGVENSNERLTWVILHNGVQVLGRNANGETVYQYFGSEPGVYTIYLEDWVEDQYRVISNVVSYTLAAN